MRTHSHDTVLTDVCIFALPSWVSEGQKPHSAVIFRNLRFQKPSLHLRIPNVAKCKWEKVYDAHLGENRAVNVAQLGLLGTAFAPTLLGPSTPHPARAWHGVSSLQSAKGSRVVSSGCNRPCKGPRGLRVCRKVNQTMAKIEITPWIPPVQWSS